MQLLTDEIMRQKAKERRIKKSIVKNINLDYIKDRLWEIYEACEEVRWYTETGGKNIIEDALDGDSDEASEFLMMFSILCSDCEQMRTDLESTYLPNCFDTFFVSAKGAYWGGGLYGYDSYEGDYMGIDPFFNDDATRIAESKMKYLTKTEILEAAAICMKVFMQFVALETRFSDLEASLNIIRGENREYLDVLQKIDEEYSKIQDGSYLERAKAGYEWEKLTAMLPSEVWLY